MSTVLTDETKMQTTCNDEKQETVMTQTSKTITIEWKGVSK